MQIWMNLLVVLQILAAIAMIGLVLIQHGKGADMGASFGSGASGSLFGATGSANFLSRSTAVCATIFFAATLGLSIVSTRGTSTRPDMNRLDNALSAPPSASANAAARSAPPLSASHAALPSNSAAKPSASPVAPAIPTQ